MMLYKLTRLTLKLYFVLNNKGVSFVVNLFRKFGGNGMMGCRVLHNKSLVSYDTGEDVGLFNGPFTNIRPILVGLGVLFLGM